MNSVTSSLSSPHLQEKESPIDLSQIHQVLGAVQNQMSSLQQQLTASRIQYTEDIGNRDIQILETRAQVDQLTRQCNGFQDQLMQGQERIAADGERISNLEEQIKAGKEQNAALQENLQATTQQVAALSGQLNIATSRAAALEVQNRDRTALNVRQREEATQQLATANAQTAQARRETVQEKTKNAQLQTELRQAKSHKPSFWSSLFVTVQLFEGFPKKTGNA